MKVRITMNVTQDNYCGKEQVLAAIQAAFDRMSEINMVIAQAPPDPPHIPLPTDIMIEEGSIKVEAV